MENKNQDRENPVQQAASRASGEPVNNPFDNGKRLDEDVRLAKEELDKEQQFKEAQTERD